MRTTHAKTLSLLVAILTTGCDGQLIEVTVPFEIDTYYQIDVFAEQSFFAQITGDMLQGALGAQREPETIKKVYIESLSGQFNVANSTTANAVEFAIHMETENGSVTLSRLSRHEKTLGLWPSLIALRLAFSRIGRARIESAINEGLGEGVGLPIAIRVTTESFDGPFFADLYVTIKGTMVVESCERVPSNPVISFLDDKACIIDGDF